MAHRLRVLVDARMLLGRFSGVARLVTRLIDQLSVMPDVQVVALCGNEPYKPWADRADVEVMISDFTRRDRSPIRRLWWESQRLHHWISRSGADVFHATWNSGVPRRCGMASVLTIHDLIGWDETTNGLISRVSRACLRQSLKSSAQRADRIITVSGFTADQVTRKLCLDPKRMRVIHNGVDAAKPVPHSLLTAACPYLLYVGGHEPRKNLEAVFGALNRYWSKVDSSMELHLTGSADQLSPAARDAYQRLQHDGRIQFLGSPNDDQLAREYAGAAALIMLSRAEGFGLPVVEAMACGCPVIAARMGALPEIVSDAGILVDPDNADAVCDSILQVARPPHRRILISRGLERAAQFSWQQTAEAYLHEYRLAAMSRSAQSIGAVKIEPGTLAIPLVCT